MKIALLIPSLQPGGMERVMSELAGYFCAQPNHEVHLVLFGLKRDIFYSIPDNLIVHIPPFDFKNSRRLLHTGKTVFFLRQKVKQINPDVVLSFGEYWNNFVLLALLGTGLRVFVSDRCQPDKGLSKLHHMLRIKLYPTAAGVIAQTEKAKMIYSKMYTPKQFFVIGNPVRNIEYRDGVKRENIVLSVGRLIASKHHDELIKLFVRLNRPGWKLIIVGGDALLQKNSKALQLLIDELQAQDRVELAGNQTDVESYYLKSRIFAFTSSSEGFPNVIGEAQAAGLPVVSFDCVAGPSDMIRNGENGYLIDLFDYKSFEKKLGELMDDGHLREQMGLQAMNDIKRFSVETISNNFLSVLGQSISNN